VILDSFAIVAIALDEPERGGESLLAKGRDFARTDIELA